MKNINNYNQQKKSQYFSFKPIDFPKAEVSSLKTRELRNLPIYTTRVADDFRKFNKGDIVITPWLSLYAVAEADIVNDVRDHPFFSELTRDQISFLSKFDAMKVLRLDYLYNNIQNDVFQINAQKIFEDVVKSFDRTFGIDLSYMKMDVSPVPHCINGKVSDIPVEEFAGSWLENSHIEICPDMSVPMKTFGVNDMSEADFTRWIIAHELAHEVFAKMPDRKDFVDKVISDAKAERFSTAYLETVNDEKYDKELFCEYVAKLIVRNSFDVEFKLVPKNDLIGLLDEIDAYNENAQYDRSDFEKYLGSTKKIDRYAIYYGMFRNGKCEALSYLNKTPEDFVLIAQVASFVKGSGKDLIDNVMSRSPNIWLAADPKTDDPESLLNYYRQFGLDEHVIERCKWVDGMPEHVFFKASTPEKKNEILNFFDRFEV